MEKYSKHLEQLVEERTSELESEKERATILLYSMNTVLVILHYHDVICFSRDDTTSSG